MTQLRCSKFALGWCSNLFDEHRLKASAPVFSRSFDFLHGTPRVNQPDAEALALGAYEVLRPTCITSKKLTVSIGRNHAVVRERPADEPESVRNAPPVLSSARCF